MKVFILFFFMCSYSSFAMEKAQIEQAMNHLEKSGMFTKEQIKLAKEQLGNMSDEDYKKLIEQANKLKDNPEIQKKLKEAGIN